MFSPDVILAVPPGIVDNSLHEVPDEILGAAGIVSPAEGGQPVWGTADKARVAELVEKSRAGDLEAMESLYEMFKGPVFNLQYRHTMNRAVAEDLLQDVFVKIFSHLKEVRDAETFPGWVFRIALNTCYSYLRQKQTHQGRTVSLTAIEGRIEEESAGRGENDLKGPLEQAIGSLPPRLRSVFILHDVQGHKHEEISRLLGCSVGTSKSQLFKARMKLRALLRARKIV